MTPLEKLARRVGAAETCAQCCESAREALTADAALDDCRKIEAHSAELYAEIAAAFPGTEVARSARELADSISRCKCRCQDRVAWFRARAKRSMRELDRIVEASQ